MLNPQERAWYKRFKEIFRLDGTLYGRRAAGSVYGNELEEILCSRANKKHTAAVCCNGRAVFFVIRKNSSGMSFASFGPGPALALFRNGVVFSRVFSLSVKHWDLAHDYRSSLC